LGFRYGNRAVLRDVSLNIQPGEMIGLVGHSGSGKSTLARLLVGLWPAASGKVRLDGVDIFSWDKAELGPHVGYLPQGVELLEGTLAQNIARFGEVDMHKVRAAAQAVGVDALIESLPQGYETVVGPGGVRLSGGQRQRIALARALAVEPQVLLLDEPFGALDAKVRKELRRWLRRLHDDLNVTSIFVTHDQEEALEVADRVVVINKGHIEQQGTPQEVWDHPASPFVYGFLGDVNLFHGRAHEGLVHLEGMQLPVPEHATAQNADARAYVRPYDLDVQRAVPGQTSTQGLPAILERAIVVGSLARLELKPTQGHGEAAAPLIEVHLPAQEFRAMGLREGEELLVTPRQARVFVDEAAGI